jgi:hypothetical protein
MVASSELSVERFAACRGRAGATESGCHRDSRKRCHRAAQRATGTIPIVIGASARPVGNGFVSSLARPGSNITGLSTLRTDQPKLLKMLRAVVPSPSRVTVFVNPANTSQPISVTSMGPKEVV